MNLKIILKGFLVGIGKIIPGISGSLIAFSLGIYEKFIYAITHFFNDKKNNFKFLLSFFLGIIIAIIVFSNIILLLFKNYYNETIILFLGLILGTTIPFLKKITITKKNILIFIIISIIMILINFTYTFPEYIFNNTLFDYIYPLILGLIDAFTSIVPGISGTAIFMMLGSYKYVLSILANPFNILFILYSLGLIIGVILTSYIMYYLLKKFKNETYSAIFAFMISSIIFLLMEFQEFHLYYLLFFIIGGIVGYICDK